MRNFNIYLVLLVCLFATIVVGQESFEAKAKIISEKIEKITKEEKAALKLEIETVNQQLENGTLSRDAAEAEKLKLAEARAKIIEDKIAVVQVELKNLVQDKADGKLPNSENKKDNFIFGWNSENNCKDCPKGENRTTSQFVLATGANNLVTDGAIANSDFGYNRSTFYEWGISWNTRLMKDNNLLHVKYGFSWMYNHLSPTDNRYFVDNNNQTELVTFEDFNLRKKETYFKNVYVAIPIHLEFDFSKTKLDDDGNKIFRSHEGIRFGIGGFVGYNTNSKQFLSYEDDGYRVNIRQKGDWNVNDWTYGVSGYFGYKSASLYLKYDLNPVFKNNPVDQNNISLGLRIDFN